MAEKTRLGDVLLSLGRKRIYIPDYIKQNAKTRRVAKLREEFEYLIMNDDRFTFARTSEVFHLPELKRLPKARGYYISHVLTDNI